MKPGLVVCDFVQDIKRDLPITKKRPPPEIF
jgi:hypothetical protein